MNSQIASRFYQLPTATLLVLVPGTGPTPEQRKLFKSCDLKGVTRQSQIHQKLSAVVNSILDAAGVSDLRYWHTISHKAAAGSEGQSDAYNDGGVYLFDNPLAQAVSELDEEELEKNSMNNPGLKTSNLARRSWHHISVPCEVKFELDASAFYFRNHQRLTRGAGESVGIRSANDRHEGSTFPSQPEDEKRCSDTSGDSDADRDEPPADATVPESDVPDRRRVTREMPYYIRRSRKGQKGLAHFVEYMTNILTCQHRAYCFSIYILRDRGRILYFDRNGVLITEPFVWTSNESPLHDFVWKIAQMERLQLGYDTTATLAPEAEIDLFRRMALDPEVPAEVQQYVRDATEGSWPLYKLSVVASKLTAEVRLATEDDPESKALVEAEIKSSQEVHLFIVGRPHFAAEGLIGRCTRGYVAFQLLPNTPSGGRLCYLKDCWRACVPGRTRPEHAIYEVLRQHNASNVATLICGGDVCSPFGPVECIPQCTRVDEVLHAKDGKRLARRVHYRIVTEEIGLPLRSFKNFKELSSVMAGAIMGHHEAWKKAGVLHCDISVGNIMIKPRTREGFLIDWNLACFASELCIGPVKPDPAGTWQYRSALSLRYPRKPYRLSDDLEAFVHVYRHLVLQYHPIDRVFLVPDAQRPYDEAYVKDGITIGGTLKLAALCLPYPPFNVVGNPQLQKVLVELAEGCAKSYMPIDLSSMQTRYGLTHSTQAIPRLADVMTETLNRLEDDPVYQEMKAAAKSSRVAQSVVTPLSPSGAPPPDSDPCQVKGYLARHCHLYETFSKHRLAPNRDDKSGDRFPLMRGYHIGDFSQVASLDHSHPSRSGTPDARLQSSSHEGSSLESSVGSAPPPLPMVSSPSALESQPASLSPTREDRGAPEDRLEQELPRSSRPGQSDSAVPGIGSTPPNQGGRPNPSLDASAGRSVAERGTAHDTILRKRARTQSEEPESIAELEDEPAPKRRA